jgi:hypothetical protein
MSSLFHHSDDTRGQRGERRDHHLARGRYPAEAWQPLVQPPAEPHLWTFLVPTTSPSKVPPDEAAISNSLRLPFPSHDLRSSRNRYLAWRSTSTVGYVNEAVYRHGMMP